jgi:LuxR family transcriptional regulator, maltose regulon positive regulatory protein
MTTTPAVRPLLRARTTPPRPSTHILSRPRLLEQMDAGSRGAVTLVCGGPGTGKTHLVIDWVRRRRRPGIRVAWAALGADCNDPRRLWTLFLASLDRAGLDSPTLAGMRAPTEVNEAFLDRLLLALEELDAPVVLVLEDLHEVTAPAAVRTIDTLVRFLPDCVHLVMITRSDPPLSLHRLRVAGGLSEVRHADLAFTRDEAVALLSQHGLTLTESEVEQLVERTEGWAVGLRLAALSLQRCTDDEERARAVADFAGDSRAVADYLVAEVLDRLPEDLRRFLLLTSVVERVDAALAEHLTGTSGGADALERLETSGVPLIPLDDHRGWYRYHRLVQELCRQRLHAEDPSLVTSLHTQAALWFAEHGEFDEGLRQALVGRNWSAFGRIAVARAGAHVFGHPGSSVRGLLAELPEDALPDDPWLATVRALELHDAGVPDRLVRRVRRAEELWAGQDDDDARLHRMVLALIRAAAARGRYDVLLAADECERALRLADSVDGGTVAHWPALPSYRSFGNLLLGKCLVWQGRLEDAETFLVLAASSAAGHRQDPLDGGLLASAYLSLVLAMRGALTQATVHADRALALGGAEGWADEIQSTSAWLSLALVHLQRGDAVAARRALDDASLVLERRPDALLEVCRTLANARLLGDTGDAGAARSALDEARRMLDELPAVPFLDDWCRLVQSGLELNDGRPSVVLDLLDSDMSLGATAPARVLRGRALLHEGDGEAALAEVEPLTAGWRPGVAVIEAWVLTALAQESLRQDGAALNALTRALQAAEAEGWVRPFLTESERLTPLLERYRSVVMTPSPLVDRLLTPSRTLAGRNVSLTDRELAVLQLLPSMMSNEQIARELFVSVNTVKVHLKSLYRKLGVSSRREAVMAGAAWVTDQSTGVPTA